MIRMQIQLSEDQARAVREAAQRERVSRAEIVRRALATHLGGAVRPDRSGQHARALAAMGSVHSELSDLSECHDDYFAEAVDLDPE